MMKRLLPFLMSLVLLAPPAGALKMIIWDRDMQTTLGAGESSGNRFNVQLIRNFSGPVIVIFSQTDEEKRTAAYSGLQNRYDGVLKNGQLTLMSDAASDRADTRSLPAPTGPVPSAGVAQAGKAVGLTLTKLLQLFKLNLTVQTTGQTAPQDTAVPLSRSGSGAGNSDRSLVRPLEMKGK